MEAAPKEPKVQMMVVGIRLAVDGVGGEDPLNPEGLLRLLAMILRGYASDALHVRMNWVLTRSSLASKIRGLR